MKISISILSAAITIFSLISCKSEKPNKNNEAEKVSQKVENIYSTDNPKSMLIEASKSLGGYGALKKLNDVSFTYNYISPDGKKDVSTEKYIFEGEISWAKYTTHEINVAPKTKGDVVQFFDGKSTTVYIDSIANADPKNIGTSQFLRQANYMWFTMMHKLTDPGTLYKYLGEEKIDSITYDKVHITYDTAVTGKEVNDTYIVYINPENKIIEQFKFSLPAFKINDPVLLAKCTYTEINGVKVITRREMFSPTQNNEYVPMVTQTLEDIKFNNGYTKETLKELL